MIGIRIGTESTVFCINPKFVLNGSFEGITVPIGVGYSNKWEWLRGSYGMAYSYSGEHTLWFHWKDRCMPRDWDYLKQWRQRKLRYGF